MYTLKQREWKPGRKGEGKIMGRRRERHRDRELSRKGGGVGETAAGERMAEEAGGERPRRGIGEREGEKGRGYGGRRGIWGRDLGGGMGDGRGRREVWRACTIALPAV